MQELCARWVGLPAAEARCVRLRRVPYEAYALRTGVFVLRQHKCRTLCPRVRWHALLRLHRRRTNRGLGNPGRLLLPLRQALRSSHGHAMAAGCPAGIRARWMRLLCPMLRDRPAYRR